MASHKHAEDKDMIAAKKNHNQQDNHNQPILFCRGNVPLHASFFSRSAS
jgi:hypothetical protein